MNGHKRINSLNVQPPDIPPFPLLFLFCIILLFHVLPAPCPSPHTFTRLSILNLTPPPPPLVELTSCSHPLFPRSQHPICADRWWEDRSLCLRPLRCLLRFSYPFIVALELTGRPCGSRTWEAREERGDGMREHQRSTLGARSIRAHVAAGRSRSAASLHAVACGRNRPRRCGLRPKS